MRSSFTYRLSPPQSLPCSTLDTCRLPPAALPRYCASSLPSLLAFPPCPFFASLLYLSKTHDAPIPDQPTNLAPFPSEVPGL
ncbi:uncharacterized protein EI90DRAFT_3057277 [Cantharellus anzutake]|uniref:uncharacterized protein n=1 Tax=Cantharellus anzutake TaxID=1750568 RepID=UPI0019086797|nr:uncharacterized protein EI90DRAFT_3057277 [Cantharellus anzutake]KAF8331773.1 hypothetical protein EI90DRAFT_3057277 [Cantharellus anzutake]